MTNLYIKQKVFSWRDKFRVYDADGNDLYYAEGEIFTLGKKLHIFDMNQTELAFLHEKLLSFMPRFFVSINGNDIAEIKQRFTWFHKEFSVLGPDWDVKGDFFSHEYAIRDSNEATVAAISKQWFTWGDTYEIRIEDGVDAILVLSVVLAIDAVLAADNAAASASVSTST